jgi:hypothetical protein
MAFRPHPRHFFASSVIEIIEAVRCQVFPLM